MARVSYFPRFSQKENQATNHTLLVLRHFYQHSAAKIEGALAALLETELSVGLTFEQQTRGAASVPDAVIRQKPLAIYIETKQGRDLDKAQLERHLESISAERRSSGGTVVLVGLTREPLGDVQVREFEALANDHDVAFVCTTFSEVVAALRNQCFDYERDLLSVLDDYEAYLSEGGLLDDRNRRLVVVPCGTSLAENVRYGVYYDAPQRPIKRASFLGVYARKSVRWIGKIKAIGICDWTAGLVTPELGKVTEADVSLAKDVMAATSYYDLKDGPQRFYFLDGLSPTDLRKRDAGGIMGHRYFDLKELTGDPDISSRSVEQIAEALRGLTFEDRSAKASRD